MEIQKIKVKHKKRRTRKCLDEIRERSRSHGANDNTATKIKMNCMTSRRLTLNMCSKAVQSKTITRSLLENPKCLQLGNINDRENLFTKIKHNKSTMSHVSSYNSIQQQRTINNACTSSASEEEGVLSSKILFSPYPVNGNGYCERTLNSYTFKLQTTTRTHNDKRLTSDLNTTVIADMRQRYNFYEEFMDEMSSYVHKYLINFVNDDIFETYAQILVSMRIADSDHTYFDKNLTNEDIIENPRDYLGIGISSMACDEYEFTVSTDESTNTTNSFGEHKTVLRSPYIYLHTPEYAFYPHKLN